MRLSREVFVAVATVLLVAGSAFADKFTYPRADVNETEPLNNTCPGEPYTLNDIYHAEINPADDVDWISFDCAVGNVITVETHPDDGLPVLNIVIHLMADDCVTQLAESINGELFNFEVPYTGTYYVQVHGLGSVDTGNYILFANCAPFPWDTVCPIDTYEEFKIAVNDSILDYQQVTAEIVVPDDFSSIEDVVVDLGISHTWVNDLIVTLTHIPPWGAPQSAILINRPLYCDGDLVGNEIDKYYFGTGNLAVLGADNCQPSLPLYCYLGDGLQDFRGHRKAGQWILTVTDDTDTTGVGFLYNFSIHILNGPPVSVDASSWGTIKASYR